MPDISTLTDDLDRAESLVPRLRAGCQKQVVWAGQPGAKTALSVIFIHGFSASCGELRPLPDLVAEGLGANLFFTRLTGHGQDGAAMGEATLQAWLDDTAEALEIGQTIGDEVIVIGCSTGCTLTTLALTAGAQIKGFVQVSPNYGLAHRIAQAVLDAPFSDRWGHLVAGATREFEVQSPGHAQFWTTRYPIRAVNPMGQAVRAAKAAKLEDLTTPTLAAFTETDQVVNAGSIHRVLKRWGGPVTHVPLVQGPDDDAMGHVMAGDVFSPKQTAPLAARIIDWVRTL
ncbi:alpha/beta hydrolase [Yoonia sp. 208BN28-4]|uniref:alpha/beta hydrolase n=1 Tax=Yoonia sp. 208BN28-4 TaxID=3126505 RepID=UPI0030A08AA8